MSVITIAKPPFGNLETFRKVMAAQGDSEPDGLIWRQVGTDGDGTLRIVAHWESKEQALEFFSTRLGPALAAALAPEPVGMPETVWVEVQDSYERGSLHA
ncbi:MAG: hypothetical protein ABR549_15205 [Mycobacteriales bacterium]